MKMCHCSRCYSTNLCEHGTALDTGNECVKCNECWDSEVKAIRTDINNHEMSLYSLRNRLQHLTGVRR